MEIDEGHVTQTPENATPQVEVGVDVLPLESAQAIMCSQVEVKEHLNQLLQESTGAPNSQKAWKSLSNQRVLCAGAESQEVSVTYLELPPQRVMQSFGHRIKFGAKNYISARFVRDLDGNYPCTCGKRFSSEPQAKEHLDRLSQEEIPVEHSQWAWNNTKAQKYLFQQSVTPAGPEDDIKFMENTPAGTALQEAPVAPLEPSQRVKQSFRHKIKRNHIIINTRFIRDVDGKFPCTCGKRFASEPEAREHLDRLSQEEIRALHPQRAWNPFKNQKVPPAGTALQE